MTENVTVTNPEIKTLLDNYFEVIHAQDMNLFDKVFHKNSCLYSAQDGNLVLRPYDIYREIVAARESPAQKGNTRRDKVLMVDQISPTLAFAKVQLEMFGGIMQDYLNLVYLDGQWWVMAKMYERVGDAA